MKLFIILILIFLPNILIAQAILSGRILDAKQKPIAFAAIGYYHSRIGDNSDSIGVFRIKKITGDSIKVSALGYQPVTIVITELTNQLQVELKEAYTSLDAVSVRSRRNTTAKILLGHDDGKENFWEILEPDIQDAVYIPNETKVKGYIDDIRFKLESPRKATYLLRIRLFDKNPVTQLPGEDLLFEDNILPSHQLKRKNIFSTRSKNIEFPEGGVFVSFELIPLKGLANGDKNLPHLIGNAYAEKIYTYLNYKEIRWIHETPPRSFTGFYDVPGISISVSY